MKNFLLALALLSTADSVASAQGMPAAKRLGDLQIGGGYSYGSSDYVPDKIRGFAFYSDFDFRANYGVEVDFHQADDPQPAPGTNTHVYERTYEAGGRYFRHYGRFKPYLKGLYGRGVFNYPPDCTTLPPYVFSVPCTASNVDPASKSASANLAYNMIVGGAGMDVTVHPRINVRADYEYQHWFGFPPHGLAPQLFTFGVAYHFPAGDPRGP